MCFSVWGVGLCESVSLLSCSLFLDCDEILRPGAITASPLLGLSAGLAAGAGTRLLFVAEESERRVDELQTTRDAHEVSFRHPWKCTKPLKTLNLRGWSVIAARQFPSTRFAKLRLELEVCPSICPLCTFITSPLSLQPVHLSSFEISPISLLFCKTLWWKPKCRWPRARRVWRRV